MVAYRTDNTEISSIYRLDLTVYDATLPEIEDIEYTRGNDPIIVEIDPATFINWEPEFVSYKAYIIDS